MTADPQLITNIYRRLQTGFCPAVQQVAQTGTKLLTLQSAYYKAFDLHLNSLQELSKSASDICDESTKFASELALITSALQQINREEEKLFVNLTNLISAVSKFGESEKDRLKELNVKFVKDEKALGKNAKRTGDNASVQEFYSNELKKAKEQHSQRYAYFAKNYLELLRKQATISKTNSEIAEKVLLESDTVEVVKRLDDVVTQNDTIKSNVTENMLIRDEANELYEQPLPTDANKATIVQHNSVKSQKAEDRSRRASNIPTEEVVQNESIPGSRPGSRPHTAASRLSSASGIAQSENDNRSLNTNSYEQRRSPAPAPRKALSPNIYKPTPILGLVQAELEEQQHRREQSVESNDPNKIPRVSTNGDQWNRQDYDSPNKKEREYFDPIPRPDYKIYDPITEQAPAKPQYQPSHVPKQPEIAPRNESENRPPPRYVKPEIKPQTGFSVADYGRTLECTQSYAGQSDHQLSLNAGDRVRLVKSGTRGWALVRTTDSRHGWYPTKFLQLI